MPEDNEVKFPWAEKAAIFVVMTIAFLVVATVVLGLLFLLKLLINLTFMGG